PPIQPYTACSAGRFTLDRVTLDDRNQNETHLDFRRTAEPGDLSPESVRSVITLSSRCAVASSLGSAPPPEGNRTVGRRWSRASRIYTAASLVCAGLAGASANAYLA